MKKVKKGLDCVDMMHSIQEQLAKEMKGMSTKERLRYIKRQVQQSPFADEIRRSETRFGKRGIINSASL